MTTLFQDIVAAVILETGRPDMGFILDTGTGEIPQTVQAATLKLHQMDYWFKDILTAQVQFDASGYIQELDQRSLPRYRNLSYARKYDPTYQGYQLGTSSILPGLADSPDISKTLGMFEPIAATYLFDDYGIEKLDVVYQAGDTLFFKSSTAFQYILAGWYALPDIGDAAASDYNSRYDSWIAREHKFAIVYEAASMTFVKKGQQENARKFDALIAEQQGMLRTGNIELGGR